MNDYMTALLDRFGIESPRAEKLAKQVKTAEENLKGQLSKDQRKLLLRLTDAQNTLREESTLYGFISGYRLADGIHREMSAYPPYSITREDEERARQIFEEERGRQYGEAQSER